jgi:putative tryptophan/tyrosine transport system substrate-binding protein
MDRRRFVGGISGGLLVAPLSAFSQAQPAKVYRIGVILEGGPPIAAVKGLKDGLRELGFEEGKQYVLEIRDLKGDRREAETAARSLERGKVDLLWSYSTSVTTAVKHSTATVPIVFAVGEDPVVAGLVETFARPGGRLTGVHTQQSADLIAKRLEILKAILPDLHRILTFYDPGNATAVASTVSLREAARQLHIELLERLKRKRRTRTSSSTTRWCRVRLSSSLTQRGPRNYRRCLHFPASLG